MDDKDVQRLEDRIDAVNREGQLRLDAIMARIDGKFDAMTASITTLRQDVTGLRDDGRNTRALIIGSVFVVLFGVLGMLIGLKQVWIGGVQVGQQSQSTSAPAQPKP